eukprot:766879-Hanusia_phi.AAC.1
MDITLKAQTHVERSGCTERCGMISHPLLRSKKPEQFRIEREEQQNRRMGEIGAMFKAVTKPGSDMPPHNLEVLPNSQLPRAAPTTGNRAILSW